MSSDAAPDADVSGQALVARELKRYRERAGLSQIKLAKLVGYSRTYIWACEKPGATLVSEEVVNRIDEALAAGGALAVLRAKAYAEHIARRSAGAPAAYGAPYALRHRAEHRPQVHYDRDAAAIAHMRPHELAAGVDGSAIGTSEPVIDIGSHSEDGAIHAPPGRFFPGTVIPARAFPARDDGRILTTVPRGFVDDPFARHPRRRLIVGVTAEPHGRSGDAPSLYALDARQARRRLIGAPDDAPLLMPHAYALDDLTLGVLWAVSNLDEALLDDDAALARCTGHAHAYEALPRSAAGRDIATDLAAVSQMWLGSQFCASHILRHTDSLAAVPRFWTREQRGEEASTWLLFAHKYIYLQRSTDTCGPVAPRRAFCVPPAALAGSHQAERVLLVLAMALMESFGIVVDVCAEPEYAAVPGFVGDGHRTAIMANWVGTDGIWQVDVTDAPPLLREFNDATGFAQSHSVVAADSTCGRLRAMAEYLGLDWTWMRRRCAELGEYGSGGLAAPRSRLLSTDGVDRACRFLAGAAVPAR